MATGTEKNCEKDSTGETSSGSKGTIPCPGAARPNWNVMAVRGKVTDQCLWSACKAMTAGFLFIVVGAGMATLGFYSDHLSKVQETKGNTTVWVKNESKDSHLGSLTYLGPIVMGIGGFTIVAACVMTFEARDTAAKIVPIWFKRTRIHVVSGGNGSTPSGRSSKASWERFLSQQRSTEDATDTRTAITQALVNFSKYLQNNVDTNKTLNKLNVQNTQALGIRKCPSEPSLAKMQRDSHDNNLPEAMTLLEASTPQPSQRTAYGGGLKTMTGSSKPQLLSVAPDTYRQAVSMDCPRSSRLHGENKENESTETDTKSNLKASDKNRIQTLPFQTSCATSSSGSMSVDIYLPQGAVTLKIHDDMKDQKKSPLNTGFSDNSRCTQFSQQSDIHSFGDDEEFLSTDLDDSVFINQDLTAMTPQIVLESLESKEKDQSSCFDNRLSSTSSRDNTTIELWAEKCHTSYTHTGSMSESLEVQTPGTSSVYSNFSTNFSFDCTDKDSQDHAMESVISNPFSSRITSQISPTQTDTSLINVSSLNSMGSSQDVSSPLVFCESPATSTAFDFCQDSGLKEKKLIDYTSSMKSYGGSKNENTKRKVYSASESTRKHVSIALDPEKIDKGPRKHSSLESAQIQAKSQPRSPKRHQHSLESCNIKIQEETPQRYLKPVSPSTAAVFSPRKTRSESLPERRPSIKRFPLLRQGALDSFAEEGGSTHRLDRSQSQISQKEFI